MSIENSIDHLATAINNLAAAMTNGTNTISEVVEEKEPEKEVAAPVRKKTGSKKKGAKTNPEPEIADDAEEVMPFDKVQAQLRGIAAQLTDTSLLFALIQKHGGTQLNDLDPSVFPQLIQEAEALLTDNDPLQ